MNSADKLNLYGAEAEPLRHLASGVRPQFVPRRLWVDALAGSGLLALITWIDLNYGQPAGIRLLYILPIWLLTRLCGTSIGLAGLSVVSAMMIAVDRSLVGTDLDAAIHDGVSRFLSLAVITLFVGHLERRLSLARATATLDPLTGVLNRIEMQARVERAIEAARLGGAPATCAYVDCDRFKEVNDLQGHAFGDHVLCMLSAGLESAVEDRGSVGRMGGDEFVVLFEGLSEEAARAQMDCAAARFARQMRLLDCDTTISYGLVPVGDGRVTFQSLLEAADRRMYAQKRVAFASSDSMALVERSARSGLV